MNPLQTILLRYVTTDGRTHAEIALAAGLGVAGRRIGKKKTRADPRGIPQYLNGCRSPSPKTFLALARALGIPDAEAREALLAAKAYKGKTP